MKKIFSIVLCIILLMGLVPASVFADETRQVTISKLTTKTVTQGSSIYVAINVKSNTADPYMLELTADKGLTIDSGYSGVITTTERVQVNYKISAGSSVKPGEYSVNVKAVDPNTKDLLQEMVFTIKVEQATNSFSIIGGADANISYELSGGDAIYAGDTNILTVTLFNRGTGTIRNAKVSLTLPTGMSLESGAAAKAVGSFTPNGTVSASFPIICDSNIKNGSYEIVVNIEGQSYMSNSSSEPTQATLKEAIYIPVKNGKADQKLDVAKPILMVSDYSFGGNAVSAGSTFPLKLTLLNTSNVDLQNIKITVTAANGTFIPVGSSNSFYVEKIAAKESYSKTLNFSSNIEIAQGSHSLTVACEYEDTDKHAYASDDVISVPVVQKTKLVVDNIVDPGGLMVGNMGYASVNFRNMGKTQLNNLVITVEGDFTMDGTNVYFVGNMQSGKSDYYNWQFYPNEAGTCTGTVTFTYEDAAGTEHTYIQDFSFEVAEAFVPDYSDMPMEPVDPVNSMPLWQKIAIPVAAIAAVIIIVKLVKRHKAKKQEALELDE